MQTQTKLTVDAEPYPFEFTPATCALLIIDIQRDFLEPGGFGEMLGNDVSQLRRTIEPNRALLSGWRAKGWPVIHTREGHRPDLADLPESKRVRGRGPACIGSEGPMGRILVRGQEGHDIIPELYPVSGEPVIDKPGKGAFWATDLHAILLGAIAVNIIDRNFRKAAGFALAGAVMTLFGFMHGERIGIAQTPVVAVSYFAVAVILSACARFATVTSTATQAEESHGELPIPSESH